jgi:hypothetical protein
MIQKKNQPEGEQRERENTWQEVVSLFHQNQNGDAYKKLTVSVSGERKVVITLTEGKAKGEQTRISFQLSEQELVYLAEKLKLLFYRLGK